MANILPSILSGTACRILCDGTVIAVGELQWQRQFDHVPVLSIGEAAPIAIEPMRYLVQGSLRIRRYIKTPYSQGVMNTALNAMVNRHTNSNSLAGAQSPILRMSPRQMLLNRTFDLEIEAYIPAQPAAGVTLGRLTSTSTLDNARKTVIRFENARINMFSIQTAVGGIVSEDYGFIALRAVVGGTPVGEPTSASASGTSNDTIFGGVSQFVSAPKITIKVGGKKVALAVGFGINIPVHVEPVFVLGDPAPVAIEPLGFGAVQGQLQVLRTFPKDVRNLQKEKADLETAVYTGSAEHSSFIGQQATILSTEEAGDGSASIINAHLDPVNWLLGRSADLDVCIAYMQDGTTKSEYTVYSVHDVKFTSDSGMIASGQLSHSSWSFMGTLAHVNDTAPAAAAGAGG